MNSLFEDTACFHVGTVRLINYDIPDAELVLRERFFEQEEADRFYNELLQGTPWKQRTRKMYDRMVQDPRLTAWYGDDHHNWPLVLQFIKRKVEAACGIVFNSVLLNQYRNGNDSVAWHSDTLPSAGKHHAIASVTFGETRVFKVRHKTRAEIPQLDIPLKHGSFLLMGETMQYHYEHHIPKTSRKIAARINLTFRISDRET
ncbi:MAG: alpha-ketoglutarate-dependent dioxygenase AlkB [Chitinophagaceae bacterium]|nr:alpha-ketoglutarate-dependent dioxygenase AlkB [Chitinophagaceae bacterium]